MSILYVDIDLAKNVFALHGINEAGEAVLVRLNKTDSVSRWAVGVEQRGYWKAVVATAAKNARMAWAVLAKGEQFKLPA